MAYDVAVVEMVRSGGSLLPVGERRQIKWEFGKPIALADTEHDFLEEPGKFAIVAGWGRTNPSSSANKSNRLNALTEPIVGDHAVD